LLAAIAESGPETLIAWEQAKAGWIWTDGTRSGNGASSMPARLETIASIAGRAFI